MQEKKLQIGDHTVLLAQHTPDAGHGTTAGATGGEATHGATAGGEAHTGAEGTHAGTEHQEAGSPLTAHNPFQYTISAGLVALFLILFALFVSRSLSKIPKNRTQSLAEMTVEFLNNFVTNITGPKGKPFVPFVGSLFLFILVSNLTGTLPLLWNEHHGEIGPAYYVSPMANISMTFALAFIVFVVVQVVAFREQGLVPRLKHLAGPVWWLAPLLFPLEVISELIRPLSLSVRLFGNIFGEEMVLASLIGLLALLPIPIPLHFPILLFGLLTSLVQATVFCLLTCVYLKLALETHDDHHGEEHGHATGDHSDAHGSGHAPATTATAAAH